MCRARLDREHDQELVLASIMALWHRSCPEPDYHGNRAGCSPPLLKVHTALCEGPRGGFTLRITVHSTRAAFTEHGTATFGPSWGRDVFHLLLRKSEDFNHMRQALLPNAYVPPELTARSIMELAEACPDLPEAQQPDGLAPGVMLHKHQRQTLCRMLEMERLTMRDIFWVPVHPGVRALVVAKAGALSTVRAPGLTDMACRQMCITARSSKG